MDAQALDQLFAKYTNILKEDMRNELEKVKKEIISEIVYNSRNLEKKLDASAPDSTASHHNTENKIGDEYDLKKSSSFQWVQDHLKDYSFQQIAGFFKQIIQNSNIDCSQVNSRDFSRNQNSFYKILDSVWDQLGKYLEDSSGDLQKTVLNGVASFISGLAK